MTDSTTSPASLFGGAVSVADGRVQVRDAAALQSAHLDALVQQAVFGATEGERDYARWLIWEIGQAVGVRAASIHDLYIARGEGKCAGFTVPAINVRALAYDTARSIFRTAKQMDAGAFLLEIARSEIAYTEQRPAEYVAVMLAAALREGFRGPVFIQGDHFQVNHKKYAVDPVTEVNAVKALVTEAVAAGFYNIDVDTSTLVDLSKPNLDEQQRLNYEVCVDITRFVRDAEPEGVTISIGGEIGEVGTENSTPAELEAFMDGFNRTLAAQAPGTAGLSKISVQSGTSHGGVVLADGSIADVALDLDTLGTLSKMARDRYQMAGAVQHGASTLPDGAFNNFPRVETAEIHLATNFQNIMYDHIPASLREEIYAWLDVNAKDERKEKDSNEQFYYKTRKKAIGPFKKKLWALPADVRQALGAAYDAKFTFLFTQLAIGGTRQYVEQFVNAPVLHRPLPDGASTIVAAPDDADLSD
ncbi:MAG TPA: aldolase [Gemmatimonas aurantiaca]|uniref:Aldolase n=2 Tax=Gemmatimonas aurantiaca TaxID=173480 RepID=A0A3D4V869_9BACT|nr:class II fructose-bisphosphate aldolase [Gemmatimonas aurantiaca]HCT56922.1 aldolase [Gemmatimonas aurantiaca]